MSIIVDFAHSLALTPLMHGGEKRRAKTAVLGSFAAARRRRGACCGISHSCAFAAVTQALRPPIGGFETRASINSV
jgi:hypothetical protein